MYVIKKKTSLFMERLIGVIIYIKSEIVRTDLEFFPRIRQTIMRTREPIGKTKEKRTAIVHGNI